MIEVTERAKRELHRILESHVDNWDASLRLIDKDEKKLGLGIDIEMPGDQVIEHEGKKILLVSMDLSRRLDGISIDIEGSDGSVQLVVTENSRPFQW